MISRNDEHIGVGDILAIAVFVGLSFRFFLMTAREFWHDEAFQLLFSKMPLSVIFGSNDVHPPLFTLLTKLMIYFTENPIYLRSVMLIISIMFVAQFYITIKEMFSKRVAQFSTIFILLSPTIAYYSVEFRSYIFVMLLTIIQIRYFNRWLKDSSVKNQTFLILLSLAMIYSHYMAGLILVVQSIIVVIKNKYVYREFDILFIGCIPLVAYAVQTLPKIDSFWFKDINLKSLFSTFIYYISPPDWLSAYWGIVIVLVILIAFASIFLPIKENQWHAYLYTILPVVIMFIISQFFAFYHHRYFLFGGMFIYVIAGIALDKIAENSKHAYKIIFGFMMVMIFYGSINSTTPIRDSVQELLPEIDDKTAFVHTSPFSQSPYKVLLPDNEHLLLSNLTTAQLFTAGGAVIRPEEHIQKFSAKRCFKYYMVSDEPAPGQVVFAENGLFVTKIYQPLGCGGDIEIQTAN